MDKVSGKAAPKLDAKTNQALLDSARVIKQREVDGDRNDARHRYQSAEIVKETTNNPAYGKKVVEKLAHELQWSSDKVLQYKAVAEAWNQHQFDEVITKLNSKGEPLTWSHLVLLASKKYDQKRDSAIEKALKESLSVRQLEEYLTPRSPAVSSLIKSPHRDDTKEKSSAAAPKAAPVPTFSDVIGKLRASTQAAIADADDCCGRLGTIIEKADPASLTPEMRSQVAEVRDEQQRLAEKFLARAEQLGRYLIKIDSASGTVVPSGVNGTRTNGATPPQSKGITQRQNRAMPAGVLSDL